MHKSKSNQRRVKTKKQKAKARSPWGPSGNRTVIHTRVPGFPDEYDTVVKTYGHLKSTATTASISQNIVTNTLLQSGAWALVGQAPSVANLARNYSRYRVMKYAMRIRLFSNSTSATYISMINTPEDPAFSAGVAYLPSSSGYPGTVSRLVPPTTNTPNVMACKLAYKIEDVVGTSAPRTEENYSGTISSVGAFSDPTALTYCVFYQGLASGAAFTVGTALTIEIELLQYVKLYDRRV